MGLPAQEEGQGNGLGVKLAIMTLELPEFSKPSAFTLFRTLHEGLHTNVLIPFYR